MVQTNQYVSDELFHFVGRHEPTPEKRFSVLTHILATGTLKGSRRQVQSNEIYLDDNVVAGELTKISAICFCDIPKESLRIHVAKYSQFGLSFTKRFLSSKGAKPVIYIPIKSKMSKGNRNRGVEVPRRLKKLANALITIQQFKKNEGNKPVIDERIRNSVYSAANESSFLATEFYYFIKMYDEDLEQQHKKNYYMEREWRMANEPLGTTLKFSLDDVKAVMVPKSFKPQLLKEFKSLGNRVIHPG